MNEFVSIGVAAIMLGVSISTLRRWDDEGFLEPDYRTAGNHRRYSVPTLAAFNGEDDCSEDRVTVCYARVSSHDQKADLITQQQRLIKHCRQQGYRDVAVIADLGSGLNYRKKGLRQLIMMICYRRVERLVLVHKDRLLRYGAEILFALCRHYGTSVEILEQKTETFEQRLCFDVIELMTVFSARLYGSRSHKNLKAIA